MAKSNAPRHAAPPGIKTGDIREAIENAFHAAGGRDYLVGVAKRRPDVFCQLLKAIIPSEVHMSVLQAYQAMPIAVEVRDAIPGLAAPGAAMESLESPIQDPSPVTAQLEHDWL